MESRRPYLYVFLLLSLGGYLFLHCGIVRADFVGVPAPEQAWLPMGLIAGLFVLYGLSYRATVSEPDIKLALGAGILIRVALIFVLPNLSDDFYRFVWDGRMLHAGLDPFAELPQDFMARLGPDAQAAWMDIYPDLNSKPYYSVYPPVLQIAFYCATGISGGDLWGSIVALKSMVVLAECGTLYFLQKLARQHGWSPKAVLLYALNPMVIIELTGNLHFEAFMIFFLLAAIWFLQRKLIGVAAPLLSFSIASKLLPVLIFPFLIRRLGWKRVIIFGLLAGVLSLNLFFWFLDAETLPNYLASIQLYFKNFEFNSGIYYSLRWLLGEKGYLVNRYLPYLVMAIILYGAWRDRDQSFRSLPGALLFALTVYQIIAPVIHPWYITSLVALCALTPFRYPILWSVFLPFSYVAYYFPGVEQSNGFIAVEFLVLLGYIAYEWSFKRSGLTLEEWMLRRPLVRDFIKRSIPARMRIKYARIARHLSREGRLLDIGTGNGGLVAGLRQDGFTVDTVDVKDISFFPAVKPVIYDGKTLPYAEASFDACTIITVLHHTPDPERILEEARRVTRKRIVIMEDIYRNPLQKHLTFFTDSLVNLEFAGHPHTNRSDAEWRATFDRLGLKLVFREDFRTLLFFRQVVYVVEI